MATHRQDVLLTTTGFIWGRETFEVAKRALSEWQHYDFDWIELHRPEVALTTGLTVGVLAGALGLWVLNACRV